MDVQMIGTIVSVLLGGGILGFVQFLINRHDKKHDRMDEVLDAIGDLKTEIAGVKSDVKALEKKGDERSAVSARVRILRFADELMEERRHSKDSYDQCLSDITTYNQYCKDHPSFKNNQTVATAQYIEENYAERLKKHDFL